MGRRTVPGWPTLASQLLAVCLVLGSSLSYCPPQCVCDTHPCYTPQSVYHQAKTVDCNELQLNSVPWNISPETQVLLLQSNNISRVTLELQNLANLTELDLSQNHFVGIRDVGLANLSQLITLYLEENQVQDLPDDSLRDLASLEELYINHNRISSIGPKAFSGLGNLLRLHLNSNRLRTIDSRWFETLPNLEILMIGENPILGLKDMNFQPLSKLHSLLEVRNNPRLSFVARGAFRRMPGLRTLMISNNDLGLLHREVLASFPSLDEVSLHSNPIRCECLSNWVAAFGSPANVRLLESQITLCASPPQLSGHQLQEVIYSWGSTTNSCLPLISLHGFPDHLNPTRGASLSLDCWATADPAPQFYWITPTGVKITVDTASGKHRLRGQGTLEIRQAGANDSGLYTCVAWNSEGGDTRSITLHVEGGDGLSPSASEASNSTDALVILAKRVHTRSAVVEWKLYPGGPSPAHETSQPEWASATMKIHNAHISYTAKVPVDIPEYNLTHLQPSTEYEVCLTVSASPGGHQSQSSCLNLTTKEATFAVEKVAQPGSVAVAAVMGSLFIFIMALLVFYMGRRMKQKACHANDSGLYTCVAWNSEGRDTRSITLHMEGGDGLSPSASEASNSTDALVILAKRVHARSAVVEWKLYSGGPSPAHETSQPEWASATMKIHNAHISYTAKVPVDIPEYNLTHLQPSTEYEVCLTVSASPGGHQSQSSCLNLTTKEATFAVEKVAQPGSVAVAAVMGSLFIFIMALLVFYMGRRMKQKACHHSLKKYMQHPTSIPLNELYPPLINLWENETEKEKDF
ncbi:UNVERIFIED_CONTAM: hypothetical protein FKN15_077638 [Acipenser sinensis]